MEETLKCPGCGESEAETVWQLHPKKFAKSLVKEGHAPLCRLKGMHLEIRCDYCQVTFCAPIPDPKIEK